MVPNFIIIGAQKAASTYLAGCLAEHPEIYMYREELPFFEDPDYDSDNLPRFLQLFDRAHGKKAVGFKRPSYLAKPECPRRLYAHFPNAKLIAVLRSPIERAVSAYFHYMQNGFIPVKPLNEGMQHLLDGAQVDEYPAGRDILEYGFYAKQLRRYLADFSSEQLLVLLYDDIRCAPERALRQACHFLGVADDYAPRSVTTRPMASIKSTTRLRANVFLRRLWATHNDDRTRMYRRASLIGQAFRISATGLDRYVLARLFPDTEPRLSMAVRRQLVEIYRQDVGELQHLIGKKLVHWLEIGNGQSAECLGLTKEDAALQHSLRK